ncbi:hypothetical protein [Sodalis glossinidius]|nr:hypothetical protein [Sodalis glossinidius]
MRGDDPLSAEDEDPLLIDKDRLAGDERNGAIDPLRDLKRK